MNRISPRKIIAIITLIDLIAISALLIIFPWQSEWALPSFTVTSFWVIISVTVALSGTTLPLGRAVASVGDLVDVAGIAVAGPIPIIISNILLLSINALREKGGRIKKLPFNIVLWTLAPLLSAWVFHLFRPQNPEILTVRMSLTILCTFFMYSMIQYSHVSAAVAVSENLSFYHVLRKNYIYPEIASLATIPIAITMVLLWYSQGPFGVALLVLPLLLVSVGLKVAFERGKLDERIQRESQLTDLGKSAASILHEVEKPITRIMMETEYALRSGKPIEPRIFLPKILEWAKEAGNVTHTLFSGLVSRIQPEWINLQSLVNSVIDRVPLPEQTRISTQMHIPDGLLVCWDKRGIELTLGNLLSNALESEPAGTVKLTIETRDKLSLWRLRPQLVVFEISDMGPGLPPGPPDSIFEPLFSTKTSGRGIGLFLCRQIAHAHGGTLIAENQDPQGAQFVLSIPVRPRGVTC